MEPNIAKISVWDSDTDEIIELEIDEECLKEMDRISDEYEVRRREAAKRERQLERYDRD
jgi:hypothetical protein